jgi:hypothetical protein
MSAGAAQYGGPIEVLLWPDDRCVSGKFDVTFVTRIPIAAAFELDSDDITLAVVMSASRFLIDVHADDLHAVNYSHVARSRGQSNTSTDAMTRQAAMKTNPASNEPVR